MADLQLSMCCFGCGDVDEQGQTKEGLLDLICVNVVVQVWVLQLEHFTLCAASILHASPELSNAAITNRLVRQRIAQQKWHAEALATATSTLAQREAAEAAVRRADPEDLVPVWIIQVVLHDQAARRADVLRPANHAAGGVLGLKVRKAAAARTSDNVLIGQGQDRTV